MSVTWKVLAVACTIVACTPSATRAAPGDKAKPAASPRRSGRPVGPLPAGTTPVATHGPYDSGDCALCHRSADPKDPGPITKPTTQLCLECHEEFGALMAQPFTHAPAKGSCTNCHNPHNAMQPKLLVEEMQSLCQTCHPRIRKLATESSVRHDAVTTGAKCASCHNPHASSTPHLLAKPAFELCLGCHGQDDVVDHAGKKLANVKKILDENPRQHAPVAKKDCGACHQPHGGEHARLLVADYPAQFYAPYDARRYALCFKCHDEKALATAESTVTGFRDGTKNLHFVHVNRADRGRTCRACHEVHASKQPHQIRDGVPYGAKGWTLPLNYVQTEAGGSCEKTCHARRSYDRGKTRKE